MPHKHYDELDEYEKQATFSDAEHLIDYIELLFLTDLGEGHMECFEQSKDFDFDYNIQFESNPAPPPSIHMVAFQNQKVSNTQEPYLIDNVPIIRRDYFRKNTFRGPPIFA